MARILVIDDNIDVCNVLKNFLTSHHHEVFIALDGPAGLDQLKKTKPHAVLLDMKMPGMEGIEVFKEIKKIDPQIPVIMLTGVTDHDEARKTLELGAYDYITKPVDFNYLQNVILTILVESRIQ